MASYHVPPVIEMRATPVETTMGGWVTGRSDVIRTYAPGPVELWVHGECVGELNDEQQRTVREVIASGVYPMDLASWLRDLGF